MTVRIQLAGNLACFDACQSFSELYQALKIEAVQLIEARGSTMVVTLDVSEQFSRPLILAMFTGLARYWLDPNDQLEVAPVVEVAP